MNFVFGFGENWYNKMCVGLAINVAFRCWINQTNARSSMALSWQSISVKTKSLNISFKAYNDSLENIKLSFIFIHIQSQMISIQFIKYWKKLAKFQQQLKRTNQVVQANRLWIFQL